MTKFEQLDRAAAGQSQGQTIQDAREHYRSSMPANGQVNANQHNDLAGLNFKMNEPYQ